MDNGAGHDHGNALPVRACVGLGANLGNPAAQLRAALQAMAAIPATRVERVSSFYRTAPIGPTRQPDFVNAVAALTTRLGARALLDELARIELSHGRTRSFPDAPRTLDLDLLLYGAETIDEPGLQVPHPRAHLRRFVLQPLVEIAPDCRIPGKGRVADLLAGCGGQAVQVLDAV